MALCKIWRSKIIVIKNTAYNLKANENKRSLVYNNNIAVSTSAFKLERVVDD
jgi:hypothetical protein